MLTIYFKVIEADEILHNYLTLYLLLSFLVQLTFQHIL